MAATEERKAFLKEVETAVQKRWEEERPYDVDAPTDGSNPPKYFVTFPYPYMNGMLHLGHGFSLSKSEFAARYMRMKGRRVLWPFGLHVTGTPIAACAQKIQKEIRLYGNPPQFPAELLDEKAAAEKKAAEKKESTQLGQHKSKRGKQGPAKPQWVIMKGMGIPDEEIEKFGDARHWLNHFPPLALTDLKALGCHIDYRRSFITTNVNPFYDSFISWQFNNLRSAKKLHYGKRYSVYSPLDGQPCADHDRASGEGVGPQEYIVVKLKLKNLKEQEAFKPHLAAIGDKDVVFPGATLRAETVVGLTNCWVSPKVTYKAYEIEAVENGTPQIYIMTAKAARNMAYQDFKVNGKVNENPGEPLFEIDGKELIGLPLNAPHCPYDTVYTLPMETITESKGTGVVMCVPSDSPDDYINFTTLLNKPEYRAKLGLKDEWVTPFSIVPIIDIPGELGSESAKVSCAKFKVGGPKDADALADAKALVYQAAFYQGSMTAGPFKGEKVMNAKVLMQDKMIADQDAIKYQEPMKQVMSRSGDECVVALCDQWYIEYGKEEWKKVVVDHVNNTMNMYFPGIRHGFEETLNWLSEWPCSRTFGLGTLLPCDASKSMIIDSLSDSTIYMAYYTVAHFFHTAESGELNLDANIPNKHGLKPEMINDNFWDFVMRGTGSAAELNKETGIPTELAEQMRGELKYWYPVDLRVSAKDLIQNHLTMFLYNHAAIWPDNKEMWPRSIYCNGHILVDGEKMSKSAGNFIMLRDSIELYSADCTRLACADAGDSMDDANFVRKTANEFINKMATLVEQSKDIVQKKDSMRTGEFTVFDKIFENAVNNAIVKTDDYYGKMAFRMAMATAYYELTSEQSQYKIACGAGGMHAKLAIRYVEVITKMLMPLAPHVTEHIWTEVLGNKSSLMNELFPEPTREVDFGLLMASRLIQDTCHDIRTQAQKLAKKRGPMEEVSIYVAPKFSEWQEQGLDALKKMYEANDNSFPADYKKQIMAAKEPWLTANKNMPEVMGFIDFSRLNCEKYGIQALSCPPACDDMQVLKDTIAFIESSTKIPKVILRTNDDESVEGHAVARSKARPGEPTVAFPAAPPAAAGAKKAAPAPKKAKDEKKPAEKHADPVEKKE